MGEIYQIRKFLLAALFSLRQNFGGINLGLTDRHFFFTTSPTSYKVRVGKEPESGYRAKRSEKT